jgi:hypothetical protein
MREEFGGPAPIDCHVAKLLATTLRSRIATPRYIRPDKIGTQYDVATSFLCLEQAHACFNARGWILTTDFAAPSRDFTPQSPQ